MPAKVRSCCLLSKDPSSSSLDLCRWQWTEAEVSSNSSSTTASTITPSMRNYHYTAINLVESKREKLESEKESLSLWYKGDVISYSSSSSIRRRLSSLIIVHTMPVISVQNLNKFIKRWWWWRITGYRGNMINAAEGAEVHEQQQQHHQKWLSQNRQAEEWVDIKCYCMIALSPASFLTCCWRTSISDQQTSSFVSIHLILCSPSRPLSTLLLIETSHSELHSALSGLIESRQQQKRFCLPSCTDN